MSDNNDALESQNIEDPKEPEVEGEVLPEGGEEEPKAVKKESKKDDKSFDVDSWKEAFEAEIREKIRKEEKDKLYKSFEKYKEDAKTADEARKAAEGKLKEYETSQLTTEEQAALRFKELEDSNTRLQSQIEDLVQEANNKISALQLELVKKEVLTQYGDEIIPALVSGNTIEEIMESAENAHREYVNIREREVSKIKDTKTKPGIGTGIAPKSDRLNAGVTVSDINKINDPKIWEAQRDKFLEEALKNQ